MVMQKVIEILKKIQKKGIITAIKYLIYIFENREKYKSYGEKNSDKIFYVIRSINEKSKFYTGVNLNLLANYSYVISHIMYAKKKGWIPVVDQLNYPVYNKEDRLINGTNNPWEYFWRQPNGTTLKEVYESKNVILSKRSWYQPGNPEYSIEKHTDKKYIQMYNKLMSDVPLNSYTKCHCDNMYNKLFKGRKKIVGVSMRNAGYSANSIFQASGHPIQPTIEQLIKIVDNVIKQYSADTIFLATEENANVEKFKEIFGDSLIVYPRRRYNGWRKFTDSDPNPLYCSGKKYQTCLDYLTEMELLARCNILIGSITSGLRYAIYRNNLKYEKLIVLNYGKFSYSRNIF